MLKLIFVNGTFQPDQVSADQLNDLFDDEDDDMLLQATADPPLEQQAQDAEDAADEDMEPQDIHEMLEGEAMEADDDGDEDINVPVRKSKAKVIDEDDDSNGKCLSLFLFQPEFLKVGFRDFSYFNFQPL